jgi:hypothetical protein
VDSVHLVEDKVLAHLSDEEKVECRWWVLGTGATNHIMGCKYAFFDIDLKIHGTLKFRDDSVVRIKGMGTMLFVRVLYPRYRGTSVMAQPHNPAWEMPGLPAAVPWAFQYQDHRYPGGQYSTKYPSPGGFTSPVKRHHHPLQ